VAETKKVNEIDIFNKWKTTQHPTYFQQLYTSMKNMLHSAAKKASYGSNLPESAHKAWAAQNFYDALRTYKPDSGASLQTHVFGAVHQKAKRLNYMYQNLAYIPEPRAMQVGLYQTEHSNLIDELGREPTPSELAGRLDWETKDVMHIQKEIQKDLAMAAGTEEKAFYEGSADEEVLEHLYPELNMEEQTMFDYIYGKHGKLRLVKANNKIDFDGIAKRMGVSSSKTRSILTGIRGKLKKRLER
jgi:DNA-directed RNA polymerase specialized sigma subunit